MQQYFLGWGKPETLGIPLLLELEKGGCQNCLCFIFISVCSLHGYFVCLLLELFIG